MRSLPPLQLSRKETTKVKEEGKVAKEATLLLPDLSPTEGHRVDSHLVCAIPGRIMGNVSNTKKGNASTRTMKKTDHQVLVQEAVALVGDLTPEEDPFREVEKEKAEKEKGKEKVAEHLLRTTRRV